MSKGKRLVMILSFVVSLLGTSAIARADNFCSHIGQRCYNYGSTVKVLENEALLLLNIKVTILYYMI